MTGEHKTKLISAANTLKDNKLRGMVLCGHTKRYNIISLTRLVKTKGTNAYRTTSRQEGRPEFALTVQSQNLKRVAGKLLLAPRSDGF